MVKCRIKENEKEENRGERKGDIGEKNLIIKLEIEERNYVCFVAGYYQAKGGMLRRI